MDRATEREDGAAAQDDADLDGWDGDRGEDDRRIGDRRVGDRRTGDRPATGTGEPLPPDRERLAAQIARAARTLLKWTAAITALLLVGSMAVWQGWTLLVRSSAGESSVPASSCVDRAVVDAEGFAAVLGDDREVDRASFAALCDPGS